MNNNNNLNLNENNEIKTDCLETDTNRYTQEVWKNIDGFNEYMISNLGRLKSFKQNKETILKCTIRIDGYIGTSLVNNNGKKINKQVHQLVAEAFIPKTEFNPDGSNINGVFCVNHKDGNKLNNTVENLEWCDVAYNNKHAAKLKDKIENSEYVHLTSRSLKLAKEIEYLRSLGYKWEDISGYYKINIRQCRRLYSAIDKNNKLTIEEALKLYKNTEDEDVEN